MLLVKMRPVSSRRFAAVNCPAPRHAFQQSITGDGKRSPHPQPPGVNTARGEAACRLLSVSLFHGRSEKQD